MALRVLESSILAKMGLLSWHGGVSHMLTKAKVAVPVSAIRSFGGF